MFLDVLKMSSHVLRIFSGYSRDIFRMFSSCSLDVLIKSCRYPGGSCGSSGPESSCGSDGSCWSSGFFLGLVGLLGSMGLVGAVSFVDLVDLG